jgi:C-methyltransferase-like protein
MSIPSSWQSLRRVRSHSTSPGSARSYCVAISGRLRFSSSYREAADFADVYFVTVGTAQKRGDCRTGSMECIAARAFPMLFADHAEAPPRRGRAPALRRRSALRCGAELAQSRVRSGRTVLAYGAASRAVALFTAPGSTSDASPAMPGRRMPGTDIPIVFPRELLAAEPDRVLLTIPDLLPEVSARFPEHAGRWTVDGLLAESIARQGGNDEYKHPAHCG